MSNELKDDQAIQIDSSGPGPVTILMDMSQFDLFNLCEERFNNAHNLRLHLPKNEANALDYGGFIHEGFEDYYRLLSEGVAFDDRMQAVLLKLRTTAALPSSNLSPEEEDFLTKVAVENLTYWRAEDETLEVLAVEESFVYELYSDADVRILLSGKIDLLVNKPGLGRGADYFNLPYDHKTYSRDGFLSPLSNQFQNYCVATGSNYLIVNRIGLQTSLKPHEKYKRLPMSYDDIKLQQFKNNVINIILQRYLTCVSTGIWTMNFTSCDKFN